MGSNHFDLLLCTLKESVLFSTGFPKRARYSHGDWASLSEDERRRSHEPGILAIESVINTWELADVVRQLGETKHSATVPLLAELWTDCAFQPVRNAAGYALRTVGSPEARRALLDLIEDTDFLSVHMAVVAVFDENPACAFDRLTHYFEPSRVSQPGGTVIPKAVLATFSPSSFAVGANGEQTPQ